VFLRQRDTIHPPFEVPAQVGHLQDGGGVGARGHHDAAQPGGAGELDVLHRVRVDLDAVAFDQLQQQLILAVADAPHGLRVGRIVAVAHRQVNTA
jgi:hypothetical protein